MRITFKLYATLSDYLPPEAVDNAESARDRPGLHDGDTLAVWPPIAGG